MKEQKHDNGSLARRMQAFVEELQGTIRHRLEQVDGKGTFWSDRWERPRGGGGLTAVMEDGAVFEKAGVNTSAVYGDLPERMARALEVESRPFFATGISLVIHPHSPFVPAVHANFRYFALGANLEQPDDQWFGGGSDLTPCYPFLEDARHFHTVWKEVCDAHSVADYGRFKQECDRYFYLPHRKETRGVGGIFFDYQRDLPEETFRFVRAAGEAFLEAYLPIVKRRMSRTFGERERTFQEIRRGRYVEFNLLYDRGTRFGIETEGRTESILISLPPRAQWHYDRNPEAGSDEEAALAFFEPRDWI